MRTGHTKYNQKQHIIKFIGSLKPVVFCNPNVSRVFVPTDCLEHLRQTVHVSIFGSDTCTCGTSLEPCRTIAMAVDQVDWGGRIVLNGNGTNQQPFDCGKTITNGHHSGIRVSRSLTMTSLGSTLPNVSCLKGIHFHRSNESLWITLTGIAFFGTPLKFNECSNISLTNCSLQNTKEAIFVRVAKSLNTSLTIRGSLCQNNSLCVKIHFAQGSETDIKFSLHLDDTKFLKNGFKNARSRAVGGVVLSNETEFSSKIRLYITADKIVCAANMGHFLSAELPTAVTTERYSSIDLDRNHFVWSRSLYYSKVKMANVVFVRLRCTNNYETRGLTIHSRKNATVNLKVFESSFYNNSVSQSKKLPIFRVVGTGVQAGTVKIFNTTFERNNKLAVSVTPNFRLTLDNVTVSSTMMGVSMRLPYGQLLNKNGFHLDVVVNNCTFRNNQNDLSALLNNTVNVGFRVTNTLFDGVERAENQSTFGIRVIMPYLERTNVSATTKIEIENVTFVGRPSNTFALFSKGNKTVNFRGCIFRDSYTVEIDKWNIKRFKNMPSYVTSQGALLFLFESDEKVERGCVYSGVTANTHPTWRYTSHVLFEDTLFQNNSGKVSGAVQIINGYVEFQRCSFIDNFAERDFGQVYIGYGSAKVEFKSCVFNRTRKEGIYQDIPRDTFVVGRFLHSESGGPLKIENTSFHSNIDERIKYQSALRIYSGGYFDMDSSSTIQCAVGSHLLLKNLSHFNYEGGSGNNFCRINVTTELFSCRMCPPKMYSLERGYSRGLAVHKNIECLKCPFGAHCNGPNNILAKPNFWGYKITNGSNFSSLKFLPCPWEYCGYQDHKSFHENEYNRCHGFRTGILCGQCSAGYSETLFSSHCRKSSECNWNYTLWSLMTLYYVLLIIYLLKKPSLVLFLKEQILWFRKDRQRECLELSAGHVEEDLEYGYIKIAFFFYQVADLLSTDSLENTMTQVPYISTVVALFNFEVNIVDKGIGCPFPGLTAVTKELFLSAVVFVAIAYVFIIYCLHLAVNLTTRRGKPLFAHYVAVAVEILLLGYDRLAETSLKLMHCVSVGSVWLLYFDGNIVCWQRWQHGLLVFNAIFVVPFVGVLYWGSGKLYNKTISWKEFVGACIVPLPFLVYWLLKGLYRARQSRNSTQVRDECTDEISKILHGPFRPPGDKDQGTLYWESVLIGGRLVFLTFRSFIPNSMILFLCMSMASVLMLALHLIKKPFRDPVADKLGTLSLGALACIAIMNLTAATLMSSAVKPEGPNEDIMVVLRWIVVAILCFFPMVIALLFLFALFSQLLRFVLFLKRNIHIRFAAPRLNYEYLDDSTVFLTD